MTGNPPPGVTQAQRGVYKKFEVRRTDGKDRPGEKHHHCAYFVLDLDHDPHAIPALKAYAQSCRATYPELAADLLALADAAKNGTFFQGPGGFMSALLTREERMEALTQERDRLIESLRDVRQRKDERINELVRENARLQEEREQEASRVCRTCVHRGFVRDDPQEGPFGRQVCEHAELDIWVPIRIEGGTEFGCRLHSRRAALVIEEGQ